MEVFRDLGIEQEVLEKGTPSSLMGDTVFATALLGDEIGRIRTWGTGDESLTEYAAQSPCGMIDLPQTYLEPILLAGAAKRGAVVRLNTALIDFEQDAALSGTQWADAADAVARELALGLRAVVIDRDAHDAYGEWSRRAEIDEDGVLLVRPDGYVAWRRPGGAPGVEEATRLLREALAAVLCRPAPSPSER